MMAELKVESSRRMDLIDITDRVKDVVRDSGVKDGIAVVFTKHTTTSLILNEYEPGLVSDIEAFLTGLIPELDYKHDRIDNNADSHLRAVLLQSSLTIPVKDSLLDLGAWQSIILAELDGPRNRTVSVKILGEK